MASLNVTTMLISDALVAIAIGERLELFPAEHVEILREQLRVAAKANRVAPILERLVPGITGQKVSLVGLNARADLNGCRGTTGDISGGRIAVVLDGGMPAILVKAINLEAAWGKEAALEHAMKARAPILHGMHEARNWARSVPATDPDGGRVALIRSVLSSDEIAQLLTFAQRDEFSSSNNVTCERHDGEVPSSQIVPELDPQLVPRAHHVRYSKEHIVLYLHRDGLLQEQQPTLWGKLLRTMREQPGVWYDAYALLQVRCIELHTYSVGGGLLQPGHRDHGSELTISILLSDPAEMQGGEFCTFSEERDVVAHALGRGDAVMLHSCRAHNVAQVTRGVRQSLVIELWKEPTNVLDRLS